MQRATRRNNAGERGHQQQTEADEAENQRIHHADLEQQAGHEAGQGSGPKQAGNQTEERGSHSLADDQAEEITRLGAYLQQLREAKKTKPSKG